MWRDRFPVNDLGCILVSGPVLSGRAALHRMIQCVVDLLGTGALSFPYSQIFWLVTWRPAGSSRHATSLRRQPARHRPNAPPPQLREFTTTRIPACDRTAA